MPIPLLLLLVGGLLLPPDADEASRVDSGF